MKVHINFGENRFLCLNNVIAFFYKKNWVIFQDVVQKRKYSLERIEHFEVYDYDE